MKDKTFLILIVALGGVIGFNINLAVQVIDILDKQTQYEKEQFLAHEQKLETYMARATFTMDAYVNRSGEWHKVTLNVVNIDLPNATGNWVPDLNLIQVEEDFVKQWFAKDGRCHNTIWHELMHAKWEENNWNADKDHMLMAALFTCY